MNKTTGSYPLVRVDDTGTSLASNGGAVLLTRAAETVGLDVVLRDELKGWKKPLAVHDPGKIVLDLAVSLALGGDCLADIAALRETPGVFGRVASDATVSRLIDTLAADAPRALAAITAARKAARADAWHLAGDNAPDQGRSARAPLVIDVDATLVTAHSEKQFAAPNFKRGYGFHPLLAYVDHGGEGTGEPVAGLLRRGNAGSNTAVDHLTVLQDALAQLPGYEGGRRPGKNVLVRIDGAGATHEVLTWLTRRRLGYSVGFSLPGSLTDIQDKLAFIPDDVWTGAYDADGDVRDGAFVAEVTDLFDFSSWPDGMRVIVRKERPHPGAQLRITDIDGMRVTAFATNTAVGGPKVQLPDLELRHRHRARVEDRIRCAKDMGLANFPLFKFAQNEIWCAIVALAQDLVSWSQMLALPDHPARRWEPKTLRLRIFGIAGRLATTARQRYLRLSGAARWTAVLIAGLARLETRVAGAAPG